MSWTLPTGTANPMVWSCSSLVRRCTIVIESALMASVALRVAVEVLAVQNSVVDENGSLLRSYVFWNVW